MTLLDALSGFEFEDVVVRLFERQGYENVRKAPRVADLGRDVIMEEETADGQRRVVIAECKHTDTVGRPVVQKLHSAVSTYDHDGPKRGMVVTSGRFTAPAREYAATVGDHAGYEAIDLVDGERIRELATEIGMDLYNGNVEIVCDETLRVPGRETALAAYADVLDRVDGADGEWVAPVDGETRADGDPPVDVQTHVLVRPTIATRVSTRSIFETGAGVIHTIDRTDRVAIAADPDGTAFDVDGEVAAFLTRHRDHTDSLDPEAIAAAHDDVEVRRFGETETDYRDRLVEHTRRRLTTTVRYTGDNNVTYTRECEPSASDVEIEAFQPVYAPEVRVRARLTPPRNATTDAEPDRGASRGRVTATDGGPSTGDGEGYAYAASFLAAGDRTLALDDTIERCRACDREDADAYTLCPNCAAIVCPDHERTERLEGTPVCTRCSVTGEFVRATRHFYDAANREAFREQYEAMPIYRKLLENRRLALAVGAAVVLALLLALGTIA